MSVPSQLAIDIARAIMRDRGFIEVDWHYDMYLAHSAQIAQGEIDRYTFDLEPYTTAHMTDVVGLAKTPQNG